MFSQFVGIIILLAVLALFWLAAGQLGAFDFIGNIASKIKNFFKEEEKQ